MNSGSCLFSSAYFPPVHYISLLAGELMPVIEKHESYVKQTYRNRCMIYSANGSHPLIVPILEGSFHKKKIKDIRIDYSKRWQQIHLRGLTSSYKSSPYFEYYFSDVKKVIEKKHCWLLDLNSEALDCVLEMTGIEKRYSYSRSYIRSEDFKGQDFREIISPKIGNGSMISPLKEYRQVFHDRFGFIPGLSILDLIFNKGPESCLFL
jgi:hypothetical protein